MKNLYLLFLFIVISFTSAQDKDPLDVDQMRKDAQQSQANKQKLKYEIADVKEDSGVFIIKYNLNESAKFQYIVSITFLRERNQVFKIIPKSVSGDIGEGNFVGKNRTIVWNYKNDYDGELNGNDFYFILDIKRIDPSNFPWTWVGIGGAAVVGGTVFLLSGGKDETAPPAQTTIPGITIIRPN